MENLRKEKRKYGRLRCGCCNGLVRNRVRVYQMI
jgi:hypothetical protein